MRLKEPTPKKTPAGPHYVRDPITSGSHFVLRGDSRKLHFRKQFDLVLTSPPFFHPSRRDPRHGYTPSTRNVLEYSAYVAAVLARAAKTLGSNGFLCVLKTDLWFQGKHIPIAYPIVEECCRHNVNLISHWIWQRRAHFSPYSPAFTHILLLSPKSGRRPSVPDVIYQPNATLHFQEPQIFATLIRLLTEEGATILDPFVGTGAVVEAAENTGRLAVGIEISDTQFRLAQRRLQEVANVVFGELDDCQRSVK